MIGDTNLFVRKAESECEIEYLAEVEIMIAEKLERGKKLGWEALCLMINYGIQELNVKKFEAKIKDNNKASINMFQKLGFIEISRSQVFSEITYILAGAELSDFLNKAASIIINSNITEYQH